MMQVLSAKKPIRKSFGKINLVASIPNLIEVQKNSYDRDFLQLGIRSEDRSNKGLQTVLKSIFPIQDTSGAATRNDITGLSFVAQLGKHYSYKFMLNLVSSVTTRGVNFGIYANPSTAATYNIGVVQNPVATTEGTDSYWTYNFDKFDDAAESDG